MNIFTHFSKKFAILAIALLATFSLLLAPIYKAQALSIPYTDETTPPAPYPAFNVYTGTPESGDEHDFLRGKVDGSDANSVNDLSAPCNDGSRFKLRVYVHNAANEDMNDNGTGDSVATETKVKVGNVTNVSGKSFQPDATISAKNAATVTDDMTITCSNGKTVTMNYVAGTAEQYTIPGGTQKVSDDIVTTGALIGTKTPDGNVWGCWDQRVWVTLVVEVKVKQTPVTPVYSCDALSVLNLGDRKYRYTLSYTTANGASLKSVTYNFGDGNSEGPTNATTVDHAYATAGTFTTKATLVFAVKDSKDIVVKGENCKVKVKTEVEKEYCPIPGKEHLPANSPECKEVPEPPVTPTTPPVSVVPSTGAGSALAGLFGSSALGYGAYSFLQKRRALKK